MPIHLGQIIQLKKFDFFLKNKMLKISKGYNKTIGRFPIYYEETQVRKDAKLKTENKDQPIWK